MRIASRPRRYSRSCRFGPGGVRVCFDSGRVAGVDFVTRLTAHDTDLVRLLERALDGRPLHGGQKLVSFCQSSFTRRVLAVCAKIRPGSVMTYAELARAAGRPNAARAVGQVMRHNRFPLFIPCHRVVCSDFRLGGFSGGLKMKEFLLEREGWQFAGAGRSRRLVAIG